MTTTHIPRISFCLYCGKKLPKSNTQKGSNIKTRSMTIGHIDPNVLFCTLRCAACYGVRAARSAIPKTTA